MGKKYLVLFLCLLFAKNLIFAQDSIAVAQALNQIEKIIIPFNLVNFEVNIDANNSTNVIWSTSSENNNAYFEVERSSDGFDFEAIGVSIGHGTTNEISLYESFDYEPPTGILYYRLKQVDYDNKTTYSPLKQIKLNPAVSANLEFAAYPNPLISGEDLNLSAKGLESDETILVVLRDVNGRDVYSRVVVSDYNGELQTAIDIEQKLSPGIYFILASSKDEMYKHKIIIR